ncbi:MAG TPA: SurA N-terminal domain-containing protein [Terracidiphilus sp.]|nr:SurA N-terminal domain-containing protein [Terracidiphilus sp.]
MFVESDSGFRCRAVAFFFLTGALLAGVAGCHQTVGPDVVATVNSKPIHRADLDKMYQASLNGSQQKPSPQEADIQRLNVLHTMIENEVLQQQAVKLNLVASDEDVNAKLTEIKAPYTEEEFNQHLKDTGITLDDLKKQIRQSLTATKLLNREIESKINVTDGEIGDYYTANKAQFDYIEPTYHVAWIFVTGANSQQSTNLQDNKAQGDADARKKIETLHNRLDSGQDFNSVAMQYSEDPNTSSSGGDLGFIPESQLKAYPEMYNAISKLKPDQYSSVTPAYRGNGPDRHQIGYAIYKLIALQPAGQLQLTDPRVRQEIHDMLHERKRQLLQYAYYETLIDAAKVRNYYAEQVLKQGAQ